MSILDDLNGVTTSPTGTFDMGYLQQFMKKTTPAVTVPPVTAGKGLSFTSSLGAGGGAATSSGGLGDILTDKNMAGNVAGLASSLVQLASAPTMLENARLQNKSLKFNLDTAKKEQQRRRNNIKGFNSFKG